MYRSRAVLKFLAEYELFGFAWTEFVSEILVRCRYEFIVQADLEDKIRRLEEDKNNVDFSTGLWEQSTRRAKKRKLDPGDPDR
jgi:hypothetical protein